MLQNERSTSFKKLFHGIPWNADTDTSEETRMTKRLREEWKKSPTEKSLSSDSVGKLQLRESCQALIMFLPFGEEKWVQIKSNWNGDKNLIHHEGPFYLIATEVLKKIQSEIKDIMTTSPEQIKFIEDVKSKHFKSEAIWNK